MAKLSRNSHKSILSVSGTILFIIVTFYSCRKMEGWYTGRNVLNIQQLEEGAKVHQLDIVQWQINLPTPLTFALQWNKATQSVVNGKHVVRFPVSDHSFIIFVKDNATAPMKAYAYKWENDKPQDKVNFHGQIAWFSFQDYQMRGQSFTEKRASKILTFKTKFDLSAIKNNLNKSKSAVGLPQIHVQSFLGDIFHTIGNLFGALGCVMVGGSWDQGGDWANNPTGSWSQSCSGEFWTWDWGSGDNSGSDSESTSDSDPSFNLSIIDYNTGSTVNFNNTNSPGGGAGGGGGWETYNASRELANELGLSTADADYIVSHDYLVGELNNYAYNPFGNLSFADKSVIIQKHLALLQTDSQYAAFVQTFEQYNYTGLLVWWLNDGYGNGYWLEDPTISALAESKGYLGALGLENDPAAGLNVETDGVTAGGYDATVYADYQSGTPWANTGPLFGITQFVQYRTGINCLVLAREQLAKAGYQDSGYDPPGQTYSIYTEQNGADAAAAKKGVGYMLGALKSGIPVIAGIDYMAGSPRKSDGTYANADHTTDHFIVIVGSGKETDGRKYFRFYDSATSGIVAGTSPQNKLYYDETTSVIKGTTEVGFVQAQRDGVPQYRDSNNKVIYTVTQIRRSKVKP